MSSSTTLPFTTFPPSSSTPPSPTTTSFTLHPSPKTPTDIWRKPSSTVTKRVDTFNAPIIYKKIELGKFKRCRVTVSGPWSTLYDQGGLVLILPSPSSPPSSSPNHADIAQSSKWVKTGIEYVLGKPWVSTVACDSWADWSLSSAGITTSSSSSESDEKKKSVTLEMERHATEGTLWIYAIDETETEAAEGGRVPLREVTWILGAEGNGGEEEREAWVGVYAATPIMEGRDAKEGGLEVSFSGWELELLD